MNFSFEIYKNIILDLKERTFEFCNFKDYSKVKKVYLRHDIDIYSENSLNLALIEKECEVPAVYFYQIDSTFYNILSDEVISSIIKIKELGHEIGLHINPHKVQNPNELMGKITREYDFYKNYLPLSKIVSFHTPPDFIFENLEFDGFINVYGDKYFKDIRYLSDSKRRKLYISLNESLEKDNKSSIQLLTHPYWWDHISFNVYESYLRLMDTKKAVFKGRLKKEILPYKDFLDYRFFGED